MQAAKEVSENFIESQKAIINSIQSIWIAFSQNYNTTINSWISPESIANAYSRLLGNVADNNVAVLRTANNLVFANLDTFKNTIQHTKDTTKQIFDINTKTAKTLEQNSKEIAKAAQYTNTRFSASITNTGSNTAGTTSTTSITSAA